MMTTLPPPLIYVMPADPAEAGERTLNTVPPVPVPLTTRKPWEIIGASKAWWDKHRKLGATPPPLALVGDPLWRISDVVSWLAALPTRGERNVVAQ